ncbi:MAG: DUF4388 domain-containing protein [Planctomycetes bacterium]|nr:DUF4388 domain-containing protein [Planctomycetota bacterium]
MPEVSGNIQFLGLLEFLQIAGFNHRNLVLMLDNAAGKGHIVLKDGNVIDAVLGQQRGVGALFPLLQSATEGLFNILPAPAEMPQQTITLTTPQILMRVAMSMPAPDDIVKCSSDWLIKGDTSILNTEEILQIFESNKRPAFCSFGPEPENQTQLAFSEGGILKAKGPNLDGAEAVYNLLVADSIPFVIQSPSSPPKVDRMLDIASLVMEGLRRRDEKQLLTSELSIEHNTHAAETLAALEAGELDISARMQIARRYLPGGEIAPATVVARLCIDENPEVRNTALETINDMPEPIVQALANDPESPRPLLTYLLKYGSKQVAATAVLNTQTPEKALIEAAPQCKPPAMNAFLERKDLLKENRELRAALRENENCHFSDILDEMDKEAAPRMRKRKFSVAMAPGMEDEIVLEKPETDERKEKVNSRLTPRDIKFIAKRGNLRQKMGLVCGNDDDVAVEIVSDPGVPEPFILGVAEATAANASALRYIASQRTFRRNASIVNALVFNPKTPVSSAIGLMSLIRPDALMKISTSRDVPDGTRQGARQLLEKRQQKGKH